MFRKTMLAILMMLVAIPVFAQAQTAAPSPILCNGKYALCTSAQCIPDPRNPKMAICECVVQNGNNMGFSTCQQRTPSQDSNEVSHVLSTFSFQEFPNKKGMACQSGGVWSNCLDQPCTVNPLNPNQAICSCPLVTGSSSYLTFGGNCDTNTCKTGFWSGAEIENANVLQKAFALSLTPADKKWGVLTACPAK